MFFAPYGGKKAYAYKKKNVFAPYGGKKISTIFFCPRRGQKKVCSSVGAYPYLNTKKSVGIATHT